MLSRAAGGLGHALAWARSAARNFWTFLGGSRLMVTLPRSRVASCADPSTQAPSLCGRYPLPRYYGPVRLPPRPVLSLAGFQLVTLGHRRDGSPVLRLFSLQTCRRRYPGGPVKPLGCSALFSPRRGGLGLHGGGLPSWTARSASASFVSRPARRSLLLRPACLLSRLERPVDIESFSRFVASSSVPTATGRNNPTSRAGLPPAGEQRLSTAHGP